jgi:hypothetical protein
VILTVEQLTATVELVDDQESTMFHANVSLTFKLENNEQGPEIVDVAIDDVIEVAIFHETVSDGKHGFDVTNWQTIREWRERFDAILHRDLKSTNSKALEACRKESYR